MNNITELQMLLAQKKEIEAKIQALKAPRYICCGSVKIEQKKDVWQVYAMTKYNKTEYEKTGNGYPMKRKTYKCKRWCSFIKEDTKEQALETIKIIVKNLNKLIKKLENEPKDTKKDNFDDDFDSDELTVWRNDTDEATQA